MPSRHIIQIEAAKQTPAPLAETEAQFLRESFRAAIVRADLTTASRLRRQMLDRGWMLSGPPAYLLRPRPVRPGGL